MVQELERASQTFPETAPAANPVFFRTYSRRQSAGRETWNEVCDRTLQGLIKLGKLTPEEAALINRMQRQIKSLSSGRWLWVGGTGWIEKPQNFSGAYNCTSTNVVDWRAFGLMMDLAMMGCGTGAVLEPKYINQLPTIRNRLSVTMQGEIGTTPAQERREETEIKIEGNHVTIYVGDSRQGWVKSYQTLLELSSDERFSGEVKVQIDLSDVRAAGEPLNGFGGVANPVKLPELYEHCAAILNKAVGRQLNSVECCLLIDEAAVVVVAGNVRRSAGMRQSTSDDELFANAKSNLWQQDENGNWRIDPERDALRMANHTRVFHHKPTLEECIEAVRNQYYSGEGAIQWAGEAVARSNSDLLVTAELKADFLRAYNQSKAKQWLQTHYPEISASELEHRLARYGLNPCFPGETLVAVADGRQAVSFEQLAQEGKDVPVYTLDKQGIITVRWMRNPRITGYNQPIVKVTFDDGLTVRCTLNHKFVMKDGSHKAAESLQYGDAVEAMTKYHHNIRRGKQDYVLISNGRRRIQAEHRLIAEFFYRPLKENEVVHHIDFCGLNNSPNNLEIMDEIDHIQLHNRLASVAGELNPRYSNYSNEDLLLAGADLCKQLGQGFTAKQWQEYAKTHGYPQTFSSYRIKALGSWDEFSRKCAELAAVPVTTWDSRKGRVVVSHQAKYLQALTGDYISVRHNGDYYPIVTKICERCGCKFERKWKFREASFCNSCSISIGNSGVSKTWTEETWQTHNQRIEKRKAEQVCIFNELRTTLKRPPLKAEWQAGCGIQGVTHRLNGAGNGFKSYQELASAALEFSSEGQFKNWQELNHEHKRQEQIRVFNDLKLYLGRIPKQEEWIQACRAQSVSGRLGTSIHNFRNLSELIKAASEANHRVISVEFDGYETVYNGTVDEFHNFFIGHHNVQIEGDKPKFTYVNVLNCGEIIFSDGHCNLAEIHLNQIDPTNYKDQEEAFTAGALSVASLLNHKFAEPRYQFSRELDPIVGVSFTGLFDFFVCAFGVNWLRWWTAGRPETPEGLQFKQQEQEYLSQWKDIVHRVVWDYCDRHNLKCPNRCTTVQPSGTKALLTGASPGWHPPKAQRFIRRITFRKNDPVALACIDYGYNVIPSQSDKDENGNLLNDPFDERCSEWLVEIPVSVPWADLPGADQIDISKFSAIAQMDFYMQVQKFYVSHNTSATIELRENEVEVLGNRIYEAIRDDEGYISAALLARFDDHQTFPRLPFEPVTKDHYEQLIQQVKNRRKTHDFQAALRRYDSEESTEAGPAGCDSDKCLFPTEGLGKTTR